MQPFSIDNSKNITIKNVNIDWDIPLTAQAEVISATNNIIELKIDTVQFLDNPTQTLPPIPMICCQ